MTRRHLVLAAPLTRGECREWTLPCRLVGCRHNLGHEDADMRFGPRARVRPEDGCSLDVADAGPSSDRAVASAMGVSRSRVDHLTHRALRKLAAHSRARALREHESRADLEGAAWPPAWAEDEP